MNNYKGISLCRVIYEFTPNSGGSAVHTLELSCHMTKVLNQQMIITSGETGVCSESDNDCPFTVHRVNHCRFSGLTQVKKRLFPWLPVMPLVRFTFTIAALKKILTLHKKHGFDIIQAHGVGAGPAVTIAGWILRKPSVWMMHGTCMAYSRLSGLYETVLTMLFRPCHLLVLEDGSPAPAKFTGLLKERVTVVRHGIDTAIFKPAKKPGKLQQELSLPPDAFVLFSPHSLIPVKGQEYAIKAFIDFVTTAKTKSAFLLLAGDGKLESTLQSLAGSLPANGFIKFLGRIPSTKMADYFALCDVTLATSMYSNKNRSCQEAMACAKPVIAFNSGGTKSIICDGKTGLLADPGNIQALSRQIIKLYADENLSLELGSNARLSILENNSWEKRIKIELAVYKSLLEGRTG
ncbi:MAG: glycosyltransferase family 4 protein [Dehalococcoidales bacterium]|nr:glycosyltransferase family 4 protein [Dehalococcoidales bacterium]